MYLRKKKRKRILESFQFDEVEIEDWEFTESWNNFLEVDERHVEDESGQNEEQRVDVLNLGVVNDRRDD